MPATAGEILLALRSHRITGLAEKDIQAGISQALTTHEIEHCREYALSGADRIDFLIGSVGLEVKVQGSRASVIRQIARYAGHDEITEIILASSVRRLLYAVPDDILGVPVIKHLPQGGTR